MCFRLLGTALPLLSKEQMQLMMRGDLIRVFGEHVVTSQVGCSRGCFLRRAGARLSQRLETDSLYVPSWGPDGACLQVSPVPSCPAAFQSPCELSVGRASQQSVSRPLYPRWGQQESRGHC